MNYDERTLTEDESIVRDLFDNAHELVLFDEEGNPLFEVFEIVIDEDGEEASETEVPVGDYNLNAISEDNKNGFELRFNGGIDKAYKVVYRTKSVDRFIDDEATISNEVTFNGREDTAERYVWQHVAAKWYESPNYGDKTIEWHIVVNTDRHEMNSLTLTDTFVNKGLTLIDGTFRIEGISEDHYSLTDINDEGFKVIFDEPINDEFVIVYTTEFDFEAREGTADNFTNGVRLDWINQDSNARHIEVQSVFTPDNFTRANGFKRGSYNAVTKEITWTVGVNYNLRNISDAVVRDFILGNQELITDSLEIYHGVLEGGSNQLTKGELVDPEHYERNFIQDDEENPGFEYALGTINTPYVIEYKTSLNDRLIEPSYDNVAYLNDGDQELVRLPATVGVHEGGTYTNKRGEQNGRVINWEIDINSGQSTLSNVVVTDIPTPNQIIMEESFELFPTTVEPNGHLTVNRNEPLEKGVDYQLEFHEDEDGIEFFELSFTNTIDRAYVLQYQTFIMAANGDTVSNDAKLTSTEENMPTNTNSSESIQVRITDGIGTGSGDTGELTIIKTDGAGVSLPGATFALYDETNTHRIRTGVTDENGELTFTNILYGNYVVREIEAPDGYLLRQESEEVVINKSEDELTFVNDQLLYEVELLKVDSYNGSPLQGAQFELRRADQSVVDTYTTDEDGLIVVTDLEPGEYVFVEIQAPEGYADDQLAEEDFEITEDQVERVSLVVGNEIKTGSVLLEKVDDTSGQVLEGAVFRLLDSSGEIIEDSLTTNENGQIVVEDLRPGSYQFVEIEAPDDYELDSEPHEFEIVQSQEERLTLYAENRLIPGSVELLKVDDVTGEPLSGAVFNLETIDGELVAEGLVSNEEGHVVVTDLRPGEYRFVEVEAPADYLLNPATLPFEIERSQTERLEVEFENSLIPGTVELTKVDDVTGEPLAGALFNIVDENGEVVQQNLMTGESGRIVVDNLRPGNYQSSK